MSKIKNTSIQNFDLNDHEQYLQKLEKLKSNDQFKYSYLRDSIKFYRNQIINYQTGHINIEKLQKNIIKIVSVINKREDFYHFWNLKNNKTIEMINRQEISYNDIKPFIRKANQDYDDFYKNQNNKLKASIAEKINISNVDKKNVPIVLEKNLVHSYRKSYVVHLIEFLMGVLDLSDKTDEPKTWLDVGCSVGMISNAVDAELYSKSIWKIIGSDLQSSRIKRAKDLAAQGREYFSEDAFKLIKSIQAKDQSIDIVSMFEFCEHFEDPASLINKAANLDIKMLVLATPLKQKFNAPFNDTQDDVHLWGFDRGAMEAIIKSTRLEMFSVTETRIGTYNKGLDWLTIVAVTPEILDKINLAFVNPNKTNASQ